MALGEDMLEALEMLRASSSSQEKRSSSERYDEARDSEPFESDGLRGHDGNAQLFKSSCSAVVKRRLLLLMSIGEDICASHMLLYDPKEPYMVAAVACCLSMLKVCLGEGDGRDYMSEGPLEMLQGVSLPSFR